MNILKQVQGKINGVLETFDIMIINGYFRPLQVRTFFDLPDSKPSLIKSF